MNYGKLSGYRAGRQTALALTAILWLFGICLSQTVTLSRKSAPPTTAILVSGTGFAADAEIELYFDTTEVALVYANSSGAFSNTKIEIPASALPGQHTVSANQQSTGTGARAVLAVNTNWIEAGFSAGGTGFNPYENVLNSSNVSGLNLEWAYSPGNGDVDLYASAAVVNGIVFTANGDTVYALRAATGKVLWSFTAQNAVQSSPAIVNGVVYFGSVDTNVYALNAATGAKLWSYQTGAGVASSPAVINGVVYIGSYDSNLYALNATTGTKLWSYTTGGAVISSPVVSNGVVYFGSGDNNVYALNDKTGAELWSFTTGNEVTSAAAVAYGTVYIGSGDGNLYALSPTTGTELWSSAVGPSGIAVANGVVYVGGNAIEALDATTGSELWSFPVESEYAPAVANGIVYASDFNNNLDALDASSGTQLWSYATPGLSSSPTVANGVVYVNSLNSASVSNGYLYAFGLSSQPAGQATSEITHRTAGETGQP